MTTIAFDGKSISCDSRFANGVLKRESKKFFRMGDGVILFGCGTFSEILDLVDWWKDQTKDFPKTESQLIEYRIGLDRVNLYEAKIPSFIDHMWAFGTGSALAIGAMEMGANSVKAVEIASKYDIYSGGKIYTFGSDE